METQTILWVSFFVAIIGVATPLLLAATGELVVEKSGVLNLGMEGMMLIGAVVAFAVAYSSGSHILGILSALFASAIAALLFGYLTITLTSNQVATGLALTLFGTGFSSLLGEPFVGKTIAQVGAVFPSFLAEHPYLRLVFGHSAYVYFSLFMLILVSFFLRKTRKGLILRAVGESDSSAHSIGYSVAVVRYMAVAFGGAMAGIAGSYFSLVLTPLWAEQLTGGRGWIALALVVFASWKPGRLLLGAYLFGIVMTLELYLKASGLRLVPPELLAALPYLATIAVLVLISMRKSGYSAAPACLAKPFKPSH